MLLGIPERLEVVDAPGHLTDLARYRARGVAMKGNRIAVVTDRPMETVEVHPPCVNRLNTAGVTVKYSFRHAVRVRPKVPEPPAKGERQPNRPGTGTTASSIDQIRAMYIVGPMIDATVPALRIQNVVATGRVATVLDLDELAGRIPGADYDKKRFPGLVLHRSSPKVAALIYTPGKIVLTGMPHPDVLPSAFSSVLEVLRAAGAALQPFDPPRVVNIVSSGRFGEGVALQRFAIAMNLERIEYEPEIFPGLVYRVAGPRGVALVFGSGSFVVTGTRTEAETARVVVEVRNAIDQAGAWTPG